ncbi:non-ribosomal peptide synthetase [Amycolatopsis sp. AA4]|uniref:AMP-binding protein n=1 Tax=Actinomycetes TaxID=1760 RepID=UPI0001DEEAB3|nr:MULTISPECIES: AMP-binding protein [Actinomycetes]ATY15325.1 non-ribosomal peptide synthetase [Amycolatopsis sp. AA4]EFL11565.1 predicted protein [Streptomyces sp. AA4]
MSSDLGNMRAVALPVTDAQRELLAVDRFVPVPHLYNVVVEAEVDPGCEPADLAEAFAAVLAVQPALRSGLPERPDDGALLVASDVGSSGVLRDWSAPAAEFELCRAAALEEVGATAFALDRPPLVRAVHLRADDRSRAVLVLAVHHSVFDGYSVGVLRTELNLALQGKLEVEDLVPQREAAFAGELAEQVAAAAAPEADAAAAALADRLRGVSPTVLYPLPGRPAETLFAGARREIPLTPAESSGIDQVCRELEISPFTLFAALHSATLARHTGEDAVVFGTSVMTRRTGASFDLCGFFVNTVPVAVRVDWDQSFAGFVADAVAPEAARARRNAAVPLSRVAAHLKPERRGNRNPVFTTLLTMQEPADDGGAGAPVRSMRQHGNDTAKFDLLLWAKPTRQGWLLEVEHDRRLVPDPVVSGYLDSLRSAIAAVGRERGGVPVRELFGNGSAVRELPGNVVEYCDFARRVLEVADACPDAVAVEERRTRLAYGELAKRVREATGGLAERGVGPGDIVGVTTGDLVHSVVAVLAILSCQAVYLPLETDLPRERLAAMVEQAGCETVVGEGEFPGARVYPIEELRGPATEPASGGDGACGVYTMFTSGSTGRPKGVLMANAPLANLAAWQQSALDMSPRTRFLQYAPLGFDVSFQEIFPALLAGGTVVSRRPVDRQDLPALVRRAALAEVTHVYLPAAALGAFARAAQAAGELLPAARFLCVAGEQLVADESVQRFFAERPHIVLVNMYGPTETHVATAAFFRAADQPWRVHAPIGRPLPGVVARIVDAAGRSAPPGVPGELRLGGIAPALGYVRDPRLSAERFVDGEYRTGDQVLADAGGELVYLGRGDGQVKIRGYRVELGEVEAAANGIAGVKRAVAAVAPGQRLMLFFVPEGDPEPDAVRAALSRRLPGYMVPVRVFPVSSIPTGFTGKLDREALVRKAAEAVGDESPSAAGVPSNALEAQLRRWWEEALGAPVPLDGSLLDHGAHSLNVVVVLSRIEAEHGVEVPVLDFFREPTVRALAGLVEAGRGAA